MGMNGPAVLSSAMLARKGTAVPTGYTPIRPKDVDTAVSANEYAGSPRPVTTSATAAADSGDPPQTEGGRTRVSVRLDRERHFKLKLTAAHLESSLQDIVTDALDRYLEQIGPEVLRNDCTCLGIKNLGMENGAAPRGWQSD